MVKWVRKAVRLNQNQLESARYRKVITQSHVTSNDRAARGSGTYSTVSTRGFQVLRDCALFVTHFLVSIMKLTRYELAS